MEVALCALCDYKACFSCNCKDRSKYDETTFNEQFKKLAITANVEQLDDVVTLQFENEEKE